MTRILVVGSVRDKTTEYFINGLLSRNADFDYVDIIRLGLAGRWHFGENNWLDVADERLSLDTYTGIFYRYVPLPKRLPDTESAISRVESFYEAWHRYLETTPLKVSTVPGRNFHNFSKGLHLIALSPALRRNNRTVRCPATIVSNDKIQLLAFAERARYDLIAKGASGSKTWALALDEQSFRSRLSYLSKVPILLQERISGWECRAHVVGRSIVAERIDSAEADYRRKKGVRFQQITLSQELQSACFDLAYAAKGLFVGIDFKVNACGEWYLLEVNSMPCFQGYDRRAGGAITNALVNELGN
jgi:RimK-like ATP-grasp domain